MNSMNLLKNKWLVSVIVILAVLIVVLAINWFFVLRKAHSTFDDYYAFRGCTELIGTTTDSGVCRVASGQVIKIVKFNGKWYLDGDLPDCWFFGICIE